MSAGNGADRPERQGTDDSGIPQSSMRERLVSGSVYSLLAIVGGQAFALLTSIIYARMLGKENLGVLTIYMQIVSLVTGLSGFAFSTPTTKFIAQLRGRDDNALVAFLSTVLLLTLLSTAVLSPILFLSSDYLSMHIYGNSDLSPMIRIAAVFLVFNGISALGSAILQGFQEFRAMAYLGIALEAATVPVVYVGLQLFGLIGAAVAGAPLAVFSAGMTFGYGWRALRREGLSLRLAYHSGSARSLTSYALPILVSAIVLRVALLYQSSFLALHLGYGDTGLFKVASTLYRVIQFIPSAISIPLLPVASEMYATYELGKTKRNLTTIIRITTYGGVVITLTIGFAAIPVISLLYGSIYIAAAPLVFVLALSGFFEMITIVIVNTVLGEGRTWLLLAFGLFQSAMIFVTTVPLIDAFGFMGVGYATLATSLSYAGVALAILGRQGRLEKRKTYSAFALAGATFVVATLAFFTANAQSNYILAASIIGVYALVAWKAMDQRERKTLTGIADEVWHRIVG